MEEWAWVLTTICVCMVLLSVASLRQTLCIFKALQNVYCSKTFPIDLNEVPEHLPKLTFAQATKRLIPMVGACSYSDLQFDLPPCLHCLLMLSFLSLLLLSAAVTEDLSPSSSGFNPSLTVLHALLNSAAGLGLLLLVEWTFVRSINRKHTKGTEPHYHVRQQVEDTEVIPTGEVGEEKEERQELTFRNTHPIPTASPPASSFPLLLVSLLLLLLVLPTFACLWSIYTLPTFSPLPVLSQWAFGIILDLCMRLSLGGMLIYANILPDYQRIYVRIVCGIRPEDLKMYMKSPTDGIDEIPKSGTADNCPQFTTLTEETQRQISTWSKPAYRHQVPQLDLTCSEDLAEEVPPTPTSEKEESSTELSREFSPAFPPLVNRVKRGWEGTEPCPPPTAVQEHVYPVDEFPIPPEADRFSDIEKSSYDTQETLVAPFSPAPKPVKPNDLAKAIYGYKPGLFGKGAPLQSVRKQRKGKTGGRVLESIVSENEEDRDTEARKLAGNRSLSLVSIPKLAASPKAAESTRFQVPASPSPTSPVKIVQFDPEPEIVLPDKPAFEPGKPLPPISCDPDLYIHIDSPTVADESPISFMTSEKTTTRETLQHSLHPSRRNEKDHSSSSSLARQDLQIMLREGEATETREDLAKLREERKRSTGLSHISLKKSLATRSHTRIPKLHESGSPYEELLWKMMKNDEAPTAHRIEPLGYRQSSRVKTLLGKYRESSRTKVEMTRHRSLSPLPQSSMRALSAMSRRPSFQALP